MSPSSPNETPSPWRASSTPRANPSWKDLDLSRDRAVVPREITQSDRAVGGGHPPWVRSSSLPRGVATQCLTATKHAWLERDVVVTASLFPLPDLAGP